ncbi:MAG: hypothetical protein B6I18_01020 [Bacteroidetes bacterium 4572_112]|nr:MAG: hypothetical protein B6I18_01020 [Bacteroidetes bacterium 4572_112]
MRKIKFVLGSLAVVAMLATVSCNKDEDTTPPPPPPEPTAGTVVVNELMTKDTLGLVYTDPNGDFCDWSEFYNAGESDINIAGYFIGDDGKETLEEDKYEIPGDDAIVTTIKSKSYLIVIWGAADASGADMEGIIDGKLFCPSSLSAKKDKAVAIWDAGGTFVDESEDFTADGPFGKLEDGKSLGRKTDGNEEWMVFDIPTPNAENK